ncbi:RagB/SusD family nutrient uptake outer membrane protein [Dyadobacter luteus]|uniref:RagB/SusD family nutrient uptake outer membrane protein n=1 Tax=Dyadobacter luteus TaxID=2259619 RepID=A0A3D8YHN0_9BACT|nr:RagB/SusD family nutrient uptake outer membrane protein [Dyadobacter luteus]REA64349.1 RagB/SusD family nutrient uptake outer membrane protein [Dyadobacter luteus]
MKRYIILSLIAGTLVCCSEKFIDLQPISDMNAGNFYKTEQDMNQAVMSPYASLRDVYNQLYIFAGEVRSDNTTFSWVPGSSKDMTSIDNFGDVLLSDNQNVLDLWNRSYVTILRANIVLDKIDAVAFRDEKLKSQYKAEARFLRALTYFWLVRVYGDVPKVDKQLSVQEAYALGRVPTEEIYDFIVQDLTFAEANLPVTYANNDKGRVTQAGAKGLLAKVYMTMAGYPLKKGASYYAFAEAKALEVINSPQYSLVSDYKALFSVTNKNSSESLFEVQYKKGGTGTGSPWSNSFAPRFSNKEVVLVGDKSGFNAPTPSMSAAYETGDPRKAISMSDGYVSDPGGARVNEKYVKKYYDVSFSVSPDNDNNWIELRLADVYLLYSEALVRQGKQYQTALLYLNKIRQRARNTPGAAPGTLADYTSFATDEAFLLAIEKERRVELAFENHRWFDLVRTERAQTVMSQEQKEQNGFDPALWNNNMLLFPIPLQVIQSNPEKIKQNPGY